MDIKKIDPSKLVDIVYDDYDTSDSVITFKNVEELTNYIYNLVVRYED